jgi:hypothetical protein
VNTRSKAETPSATRIDWSNDSAVGWFVRKASYEKTHSQTKDIYHSLFRWSG